MQPTTRSVGRPSDEWWARPDRRRDVLDALERVPGLASVLDEPLDPDGVGPTIRQYARGGTVSVDRIYSHGLE